MRVLNNFGPRVTGSHANEVLTVNFLKREIAQIQKLAHSNQKIHLDIQNVTGSYWLGLKPHGLTNTYRNVQNVIVKLDGRKDNGNEDVLMLNCHFDTVAGSPGKKILIYAVAFSATNIPKYFLSGVVEMHVVQTKVFFSL